MRQRREQLYRICTGAHFSYKRHFSVLSNDEMSPVHFHVLCLTRNSSIHFAHFNFITSPREQQIIATEEANELQTLINRLPYFLREVTYLHYYKNLTIPQIARLVNIPAPLVKNRLALSIYWLKIFIVKHKPPE